MTTCPKCSGPLDNRGLCQNCPSQDGSKNIVEAVQVESEGEPNVSPSAGS
jgi:hypothetical protein